jgi:hypothetical protein
VGPEVFLICENLIATTSVVVVATLQHRHMSNIGNIVELSMFPFVIEVRLEMMG